MEEWIAFYGKYKEWIIPGIFLVLSIPTAIISNRLDAYLKNRSLSARERKIKTLLVRYINIENQKERHTFRNLMPYNIGRDFILIAISVALDILIFELIPEFSWFRFFLVFIVSIPMYYAGVMMMKEMSNSLANLRDFEHFDSFKRRTIRRLQRLGCNPKDYGIE